MWKNTCKLLLFDLDGTLLQSDKTISKRTLSVLKQCREKGILIGVSTSRSEQNSLVYLNELMPDILKCTLCQGHYDFFLFRFLFYICLLCRGINMMPLIDCFHLLL